MFVYADNAATTSLAPYALNAMMPFLSESFGNPSSVYALARGARRAVEEARAAVAGVIGADANEIYFTSCGTEADNWAVKGAAAKRAGHIITSSVEHHAVLHSVKALEKLGYRVTCLPVDAMGRINVDDVGNAFCDDTFLVTIMAANNEIGTVYPIAEIGALCRGRGVTFHTDAVQAAGHIPLDVKAMNIDLLSLSAHKFRGPKGVGALYIRRGVRLPPLLDGGGHERGLRSGTENVAGIVGLAAALAYADEHMTEHSRKVTALRTRLTEGVLKIPGTALTGDPVNRLPGVASFVIDCIEGESVVLSLDMAGICASSGSACSSGSLDPSHVLLAAGLPHETAHGSLRLSLNEENTEEQVDYIIETLNKTVDRLRKMSPLWHG